MFRARANDGCPLAASCWITFPMEEDLLRVTAPRQGAPDHRTVPSGSTATIQGMTGHGSGCILLRRVMLVLRAVRAPSNQSGTSREMPRITNPPRNFRMVTGEEESKRLDRLWVFASRVQAAKVMRVGRSANGAGMARPSYDPWRGPRGILNHWRMSLVPLYYDGGRLRFSLRNL